MSLKNNHSEVSAKRLSAFLLSCGLCMLSLVPAQQAFSDDDEPIFEIGGRVLDMARNPLVGAQVRLLDFRGNVIVSASSGGNGVFALKHKECETCTLSVVPDEKSAFSSALIEDIPGNIDRKFVVTLQQGFRVSGRITGGGKGLKGLVVKVSATGADARHVHAGGAAKTIRGGSFNMNLTPGPKHLVVMNDKYDDFISRYETDLSVTADRELPEINLPTVH